MKKLLVGLLLVASSVLSFGAQRVPYEKLSFPGGYISYNDEKFTGEFERKDPRTGKINMVGSVKNGELHGTSYSYDENGKVYDLQKLTDTHYAALAHKVKGGEK